MGSNKTFLATGKHLYVAALIGLGFLWMGTAYIAQAYRLLTLGLSGETGSLLICGAYYVCQAAGIGAVALLFHKRAALAGGRALPFVATLFALGCTSMAIFSSALRLVIASGALLNFAIGVLSGCYLTRLATDIPQQRRGLVFGGAYAFGSLGTWLISLPMGGRFLWHSGSFFAVAVLALAFLLLIKRLEPPATTVDGEYQGTGFGKKLILLAATLPFLLSMENSLGFAFPLGGAQDSVYIEFTRVFYGVGLVVAGFVSDKNRRWGAVCCLAALAFPFAALALGGNAQGETAIWILAYLFLGFWSVYRILVFSDLASKTRLPVFAPFGLLMGRLGEAAGTLGAALFTGTPLVALSGAVFMLVIVLFFLLYQKLYAPDVSAEVMEQQRLTEYARRFGLSARQQDILRLIVKGMSNAEISDALYITESTVKFHAGNIFKKTGRGSRLELIADYKLGNRAVR
ncbi:MAG: helix-turn-helix transcriptional regulator [Bacillota bacterium]|jgi:DNA-binding CsgD family transcriptional regulator/MFS family permease